MKKLIMLVLCVLGLSACGVNSNNDKEPVIEIVDTIPADQFQPCYGENKQFVIWIGADESCSNYPYTIEDFNLYLKGEWYGN